MSKADYPYPEDEFDATAGRDVPRGVHREPRTGWSRWWPFALVVVLAPLLAFGLVSLYTNQGSGGSDDGTGQTTTEDETPAATDTTKPGATTPPPATPETPAQTTPAAQVNLDAGVAVLNGAKIQGLAARQAAKLTSAGFTKVTTGNASAPLPEASTVFYASDDLEPTAQKVADTLGIAKVEQDAGKAGASISVVLTTDPDA